MDLLCDAIIEVHLKEKRNKKIPGIEWKIVRKVFCDAKSNYCLLYLKKKYQDEILLNKRSELISKCRHENKNIGNSVNRNNDSMD